MVSICKGIVAPRKLYSAEKVKGLKNIISDVRVKLKAEFGDLDHDRNIFAGDRFNDDEEIIARLESANQDVIKKYGWHGAIRSALIDAMHADYWYMFEKKY